MDYELSTISVELIDPDERTYQITTSKDYTGLCRSIKSVGLLIPPVLAFQNNRKIVISGFRRIEACGMLNITELPVRLLPGGTAPATCVQIAIADNTSQRSLNPIEISRCFNLILNISRDKSEFSQMVGEAGLPSSREYIDRMLPLCKMSRSIQNGLIEGAIALSTAFRLEALDPISGEFLARFLSELRPSLRIQLELLENTCEIAIRENLTPVQVLEEESVDVILSNPDLDRNQKIRKLRLLLNGRRFPTLASAKARFEKRVKLLELGSDIQLLPPKNFEDSYFTLQVRFKTREALKAHHQKIAALHSNSVLTDILKKD